MCLLKCRKESESETEPAGTEEIDQDSEGDDGGGPQSVQVSKWTEAVMVLPSHIHVLYFLLFSFCFFFLIVNWVML